VITGEQGNGVERHAATRTVCYQVIGDPAVKPSTSGKVWFITGTSRGFGRIWAEAALERGDRVAATARDITAIQPLADKYGDAVLPMTLDITDAQADRVAVERAFDHFGRVDVIVNNAGYGLFGAVEEVTEEQARRQIDTGLFGALWITQAALPRLRAQGSGHIVQISSLSGLVTIPYLGMYQAAKFGLEGYSESLATEVAAHGIKVTIVEPCPYDTDWVYGSKEVAAPNPAYDHIRAWRDEHLGGTTKADPEGVRQAMLDLVDSDKPLLRLLLGSYGLPVVEAVDAQRLATWKA
jgi:NAD(P)-dependent dehydrogenase (short-subunit alcohol dehydrogenase family)